MKKKQHKNKLIISLSGLLVPLTIFFPALSIRESDRAFTGLEVVFGTEFVNFGFIVSGELTYSLLGLFAYSLPGLAVLVLWISRRFTGIALGLFIVSTGLLIILPEFTGITMTLYGSLTTISVNWTIAYGLISAIILSAIGTIGSLYHTYLISYKK